MIVIANWKQNKTFADLKEWVEIFDANVNKDILDKVVVVIAPSFPLISPFKMITQAYPYIKIASQDISRFEAGAHTGEVGAFQLKNIAEYAIIGHSERRKNGETNGDVTQKFTNARNAGINPIICFSDENELAGFSPDIRSSLNFAYEPANAISTAENSTGPISPDQVKNMVEKIGVKQVIYGGSVDQNTVENYLNLPFIVGFLVGGASLDPLSFAHIVNKSANS